MQHNDPISIENNLSLQMLDKAAHDDKIKEILLTISHPLLTHVVKPLQDELAKVTQFSDIPDVYQPLLVSLCAEFTSERRQYGAIYPEIPSSKEILDSIEKINTFLQALEKKLLHVKEVNTVEEMAQVIKIIIELTCTYYEGPSLWHTAKFDDIKTNLSPTTEEIDIRLTRTQLGEPAKFATTFGIGTSKNDFGLQTENIGRISGKSIFGCVSMEKFLSLLCADYDKTPSEKSGAKLDYYTIPRDKSDREPLDVYAKKWKTFFEKTTMDPDTKQSPPLIASVSRSAARTLTTLQDLGALNTKDGVFDFNKAQIVANCLMGFIVHGSHHSITEVAEVYNRLLDYIAIDNLKNNIRLPNNPKEMPYYNFNNYSSFFNNQYAAEITSALPSPRMKNT